MDDNYIKTILEFISVLSNIIERQSNDKTTEVMNTQYIEFKSRVEILTELLAAQCLQKIDIGCLKDLQNSLTLSETTRKEIIRVLDEYSRAGKDR